MVAPALRLVVFGGFGRMGREVVALAEADAEITLCGIADQKTSLETLKSYKPNVVIEFSSVEGVKKISQWCAQNKVALVSGTTGLDKPNEESLKTYAKKAPVFRSANMSIGINALAKVIREFAKNFPNSDVQVEEIHHKHKKDNPSGTALFLEKQLKDIPSIKLSSSVGLRGGEIFGIHKVYFFAKSEWLCFEHHAQNRTVFAEGAIRAAKWLQNKKPGVYSMLDILNE